jgi:hypothetical protein
VLWTFKVQRNVQQTTTWMLYVPTSTHATVLKQPACREVAQSMSLLHTGRASKGTKSYELQQLHSPRQDLWCSRHVGFIRDSTTTVSCLLIREVKT